jgi:general secretion pathway protein C
MDGVFGRYLWVVHFLVLPLGAYLVADMINLIIGSRLEASVKSLDEAVSPSFLSTSLQKDYHDIIEGNIFNSKMRGIETVEPGPAAETHQAPPVDLRVILMGTVVGEGAEAVSYAIIENQITREQLLYRLGESIDNQAEIIKIDRNEVVLQIGNAQKHLRLYLEEELEPEGMGMTGSKGQEGGVVKLTSNQWVLDRQEITAALDNLSQLLTKARVVPNFSGGKPDGFRIFSIVQDSFFSKIGLQNGDVLQRINGVEIKDPENFMRVFQQLKGEAAVTLDLVRNNQKQTFAYEIR